MHAHEFNSILAEESKSQKLYRKRKKKKWTCRYIRSDLYRYVTFFMNPQKRNKKGRKRKVLDCGETKTKEDQEEKHKS